MATNGATRTPKAVVDMTVTEKSALLINKGQMVTIMARSNSDVPYTLINLSMERFEEKWAAEPRAFLNAFCSAAQHQIDKRDEAWYLDEVNPASVSAVLRWARASCNTNAIRPFVPRSTDSIIDDLKVATTLGINVRLMAIERAYLALEPAQFINLWNQAILKDQVLAGRLEYHLPTFAMRTETMADLMDLWEGHRNDLEAKTSFRTTNAMTNAVARACRASVLPVEELYHLYERAPESKRGVFAHDFVGETISRVAKQWVEDGEHGDNSKQCTMPGLDDHLMAEVAKWRKVKHTMASAKQ